MVGWRVEISLECHGSPTRGNEDLDYGGAEG